MTIPEELAEHPLAVEADAPAEEQPITLHASNNAAADFHDYGLVHLTIGDAKRLRDELQRVLNDVAEYLDNPVYTECANWRCGNEVRDGGDYCAFCVDAGKGTPAWGPIR